MNALEDEENRFIPSKELPISNFLIGHEINILRISEFSIDFEMERELVPGAFFRLEDPCHLVVKIMPHLESSPYFQQKNIHHGIFHSLNNDEKNKLRQYLQQKK